MGIIVSNDLTLSKGSVFTSSSEVFESEIQIDGYHAQALPLRGTNHYFQKPRRAYDDFPWVSSAPLHLSWTALVYTKVVHIVRQSVTQILQWKR